MITVQKYEPMSNIVSVHVLKALATLKSASTTPIFQRRSSHLESLSKELDSFSYCLKWRIFVSSKEWHNDKLDVVVHRVLNDIEDRTAVILRVARSTRRSEKLANVGLVEVM